jgi:hypothetical protein
LKKAFTTALILTHWIPDAQIIIETDTSDYALAAILSIITPNNEVHPVAFHSRTFTAPELNYDIHDKELLAIFEAFHIWQHYLEGSPLSIEVVTDHKNLEYFVTTKVLTCRQVRWSEYLAQFNLVIRFWPGRLGTKPDSLTRQWDVYPKERSTGYVAVNLHNFRPVVTQEQLAASVRATTLFIPTICAAVIIDYDQLHADILSTLPSDPLATKHLSNPLGRWSKDLAGLLQLDNRLYVPDANNLHLRVLQYKHDHMLASHFGQNKTLELIWWDYTWPNIWLDVNHFCKSCVTCMQNKPQCHKPYGLLKQLLIPDRLWNSISMDFIETLPKSSGYNAILVIIDRLTKQSIFIHCNDTITLAELARLFVLHVFSKHGVPSHVTSDRGSKFVSRYFRSLGKALDMTLHFTSSYHPEGDGQTERVNQSLEQHLRVYCNYQQDNWAELLPLAEFTYNNAPKATTGISPFYANKGYNPAITVYPERDLALVQACNFAVDSDNLHLVLKSEIGRAQKHYQASADAHQLRPPNFKVGNKVFIKAKFFRTTRPMKKLSEKYFGPFKIIAQAGTLSFTLWLPDSMCTVHLVFHVSMLEPHTDNTIPNCIPPPPEPIDIDSEIEYEIDRILNSKID